MKGVLEMTDKLKVELPRMLEEHHIIVEALKKLSAAAEKEKKRARRPKKKPALKVRRCSNRNSYPKAKRSPTMRKRLRPISKTKKSIV